MRCAQALGADPPLHKGPAVACNGIRPAQVMPALRLSPISHPGLIPAGCLGLNGDWAGAGNGHGREAVHAGVWRGYVGLRVRSCNGAGSGRKEG